MSDQNPHLEAQRAIRWLQSYFKSLKAWVREIDGAICGAQWTPFEANRISTALGNGYQDSTEWVLNWITRFYYQDGSNKTLFVYLPLATNKTTDEVDVFCYFLSCVHIAPAPESGIPSYGKDWLLGSPVIEFLRGKEQGRAFDVDAAVISTTFRDAKQLRVLKVPMTSFGKDPETVKKIVLESLAEVMIP